MVTPRPLQRLVRACRTHAEAWIFAYYWIAATALAFLVEKPRSAFVGLATVAPFLLAYVVRVRRRRVGGGGTGDSPKASA